MLNYFLIGMMIVVGIGPMMWEMRRGRFDFFNLKNPFIIYYLLQLGVSGLVTLMSGQPSEIGLDPVQHSQVYEEALALSLLGLFIFQWGYYTQSERPLRIPLLLRIHWIGRRSQWLAAMLLVIGFGGFYMILSLNGGFATFLENRETFRAGGLVGQGIFMFPATSVMALAALIYFLGNVAPSSNKSTVIKSLLVLFIALIPAYFIGFRSALGLPILQYMVVWNYAYREIRAAKLIATLVIVTIAFTLYGISRAIPPGVSVQPSAIIDVAAKNPELIYSVVSRSKGTEVVASVIKKLDQTGEYDLGWKSIIEAATIIIPRSLWEEKPEASSERFTTYFFARDLRLSRGYEAGVWGGISPTVVGELYWHLGWLGVLVGLYLMGKLARAVYSTLQRNSTNPSVLVVYAIFFTSFAMFAEALQGYVNGLVMYGIVISMMLLALTMRVYPMRTDSV
ncbi:MAG: O-antigen polymerase [Gammaproteobacteria bacterium]